MKPMELMNALNDIDERMIAAAARPPKHRFTARRILVLAAALVLIMALSIPALATMEPVYRRLYDFSPRIAQYLKPVNRSCVDQGIEFRVISAEIEGDTAYAYVAIRDLTGNRVDETSDLFDTLNLRMAYDQEGTCSFVSYDEETHEATFLALIRTINGEKISRQKVTLSLSEILSGKQELEVELPDFPIDYQPQFEEIPDKAVRGKGNTAIRRIVATREPMEILPGISITAAGYMDGKLQVQMLFKDIRKTDNHGFVYLTGAQGDKNYGEDDVSYWADFASRGLLLDNTDSYQEQVFLIAEEELATKKFFVKATSAQTLTTGYWEITFPLEEVP